MPFQCNVQRCPIQSDKSKIELPCLPEDEFTEVVLELKNTSQRNFTVEVVPPLNKVSGLLINPLVKELEAGRSTLVSVRYDSKFRDIDYKLGQSIMAQEIGEGNNTGLVQTRNKRLEERLKKEKQEKEQEAVKDPKAKPGAKAPPPKAAPKAEDKPAANAKPVKKTQQQIDEEEAEERRLKEEAEAAERRRQEALEAAFDKTAFLKQLGGAMHEFDRDTEFKRT